MENLSVKDPNIEEIYLAGGCFWGTEEYIKRIKGVIETKVGYINGDTEYVTYEEVCNNSGHAEAVYIKFDANIISLDSLLTEYYRTIDPTSLGRQGMDIGVQYRTGIYYTCESHRPQIEDSIKILQKNINTQLLLKLSH